MSSNRQPETPRFGAFRKNNLPSSSSTNDTRRINAVYSLKVMQAKMASKKTGNTAQNEVFHQGFL